MAALVTSQLTDGLSKIDFTSREIQSLVLPVHIIPCLMWPLKLYDANSTTALKMDAKANN